MDRDAKIALLKRLQAGEIHSADLQIRKLAIVWGHPGQDIKTPLYFIGLEPVTAEQHGAEFSRLCGLYGEHTVRANKGLQFFELYFGEGVTTPQTSKPLPEFAKPYLL